MKGLRAVVVGLGKSGVGAVRLLLAQGAEVTVEESKPREALGELLCFEVVARYPARIGCALMPWRALAAALGSE